MVACVGIPVGDERLVISSKWPTGGRNFRVDVTGTIEYVSPEAKRPRLSQGLQVPQYVPTSSVAPMVTGGNARAGSGRVEKHNHDTLHRAVRRSLLPRL